MKSVISFILTFAVFLNLGAVKTVFSPISNAKGLSNSSINCIFQDSSKIMWFGTWDGLNSFNGYSYESFNYEPDNPNSITNNIIREIVEQNHGILWVATDRGINRINTYKHQIERFYLGYENATPSKENSFRIANGINNTIFCTVYEWSLLYYNAARSDFFALNLPQIGRYDIIDIKSDAAGQLWLLSEQGEVYCVQPQIEANGTVTIRSCVKVFKNVKCASIFRKNETEFWFLDFNNNLYTFHAINQKLIEVANLNSAVQKGKITGIVSNDKNLVISYSIAGLYNYSFENKQLTPIAELGKQGVLSLCWSNQKILWIGTDGNGLILMYDHKEQFNTLLNINIDKSRRSPVRAFCEDTQQNIWVGSKGDGICIIADIHQPDPVIRQIAKLDNNSVFSIIRGFENDMFVGTDGAGISVCSAKGVSKIDLSILENKNKRFYSVYSMYFDKANKILWVGTSGYGLVKLILEYRKGNYKAIDYKIFSYSKILPGTLSNNIIYSIVPETNNRLWIATRGGGLNLFDTRKETFKYYQQGTQNSISNNDVLCVTKASDGRVWVGTSYGLNCLTLNSKGVIKIKQYTVRSGLPNNTIHGIVEDNNKMLWFSSNKGITKFNPSTEQFVNYNSGYDLQNNEFSDGAYYKSGNGELFFGGVSGFNFFSPLDISERTYNPPILISAFKINNSDQNILDRIVQKEKKNSIELAYDENFFNIGFVALDYINNANCEYSYMLEGFNKEWAKMEVGNTAVFTNVPPGNYIFRVKSTNGDKLWSDNEQTIHIYIASPWWATWWAMVIYSILILWIAYVVYAVIKKRISLNRTIFLERLTKKQQHQMHEAKLGFFTNIAHEFSTPLTLIYGPCEKLLEHAESDEFAQKHIRIIKSSAERMQRLISELMDFRKAETGHRKLLFESVDIYELVKYIADNFSEFAEERKIRFTINISNGNHYWVTDRDCFEKILFNLISNAYKYTNEEGYIDVNMEIGDIFLNINVINSGPGIKTEDLEHVFDRFKILDNFEKQISKGVIQRTGIGLALTKSLVELLNGEIKVSSIVGEFVNFSITLPSLKSEKLINGQLPEVKVTQDNLLKNQENLFPQNEAHIPLILVVDDEPIIRKLIKDCLSDQYRIVEASDGVEALEIMKFKRPALIISDIIMPNMDGAKLLTELKNNIYTNHIPVIFLSSKTSVEDQISGYQSGLEIYLTKPFSPKHLATVVNQILEKRKTLKDYYTSTLSSLEEYNGHLIQTEEKDFLLKITNLIEANIENEQLNPDFLSREMAISRIQLYRKIRELCDVSPSEFIRREKLQNAAKLLKSTTLHVQEIMFQSGFNNKSYFFREFQKKYGVSPKEYRQ